MIRMKIAFVLRLIDDFSGKSITDKGFLFRIHEKVVHPIEKEDGLYVFLEPQEAVTKIVIESAAYHLCSVRIEKKLLDPQEPVAEVRLYEKAGKHFSNAIGWLNGKIDQKEKVPLEIYAKKSSPLSLKFKEYRSLEGEHWFLFSGFTKENILGKTWVIEDKKHPVLVILQEKRGINEYRADMICGEPEKIRSGTTISRAYRSVTDCQGAYAIPVDSGEETKILEVISLHENKKFKKEGD